MRSSEQADFLSVERDLALRDTRLFGESGLGLKFDAEIHHDILAALDSYWADLTVIIAFRGSGKTTDLATHVCREVAKNRDFRCLVVSVDDEKATEIVDFSRKNLEQPQIEQWFGPFKNPRLWSMDEFEVLGRSRAFREPTVMASGMRSYRPGGHYNLILVDDAEDDEWTNSAEKLEATRKRFALLAPMCDVGPRPRMIVSATPWTDMDLAMSLLRTYGLLREERQSDGSLKRVIRDGERVEVPLPGGGVYRVQVFYKPVEDEFGNPVYPNVRSREWIAAKKMEMALQPDLYAAQYRLDPMPTENAKFRPEDFRFTDDPPTNPAERWCGVDAASSLKPGSDHTAITIASIDEDFRFTIEEGYSRQMDGRELVEEFFTIDQSYPNIRFVAEEDRYMAGLKLLLEEEMRKRRRLLDIHWINAHARTKKESRIEAMQPLFRMGSVTFVTGRADPLYDALRRFPKGRKDLPDALANIYEVAQSAAPVKKAPVMDESDLGRVPVYRRTRIGDEYADQVPHRVRLMKPEEIDWRML